MEQECIEINRALSEQWTIGRYCALCGESFPTYPSDYETICPECKKVWAKLKQWVLNWEDNE